MFELFYRFSYVCTFSSVLFACTRSRRGRGPWKTLRGRIFGVPPSPPGVFTLKKRKKTCISGETKSFSDQFGHFMPALGKTECFAIQRPPNGIFPWKRDFSSPFMTFSCNLDPFRVQFCLGRVWKECIKGPKPRKIALKSGKNSLNTPNYRKNGYKRAKITLK